MIGEVLTPSVGCNGDVQMLCFDQIRPIGLGFSIVSCFVSQLSPKDLIVEHPDWVLVRPVNSRLVSASVESECIESQFVTNTPTATIEG
jgi:hypothetical protein